VAQGRRQEVLERIAGREHQPAEPSRVVDRHPLGDRATGVIGYERHAVELELLEELLDHPRQSGQRHVGVRMQPELVRAERPIGRDAAVFVGERRDHPPPEPPVGDDSMQEDDRRSLAPLAVADRPRRGFDLSCLAEDGVSHWCFLSLAVQ
jgi:hypothetical protein